MNTKALKQKILDLAIHGKLLPLDKVEKIRKEEPASILLEKIRAEKQEKIAKGELKKDKKDSFIFLGDDKRHYEKFVDGSVKDIEDEIPFDIPDRWSWCRLPNLCSIPITDGTHKTPTYSDKENGIPFLSSKDVASGKIDWSKIKYITNDLHEELHNRIAPKKNDILLAKNGTTGIGAIVEDDTIFDIYVTLALIRPILKVINPKYLLYVINSQFCKNQFNEHLTGIGVPNLHLVDINKTLIPLPPLAEQQLIVEEIEKIFAQIDLLEQNKTDLQTAIKQAKSKILNLAIHGKLVPQDPNDEPVSVLLEKIRAEKEAKIAKGELKKDKKDSFIFLGDDKRHYEKFADGSIKDIEDEIPFDIPDGWSWCRLGEICHFQNGYAFQSNKFSKDGKTIIIRISDIKDGYINLNNCVLSQETEIDKSYIVNNGDLLIAMSGATTGKNGVYNSNRIAYLNQRVGNIKIRDMQTMIPSYRNYYIQAMQEEILKQAYGGAQPNISSTKLSDMFLPLPPLSEQQRIVSKIEEIFAILDRISSELGADI